MNPRAQALLWRFEAVLVRGTAWLLLRLGPAGASNFLGGLFRAVGPLLPVSRVAHANLRAALPDIDEPGRRRIVRDMWESLGRTAGEFPHLSQLRQNEGTGPGWRIENLPILTAQVARGGPAIFMSGHIGNWEMLPPVAAHFGAPVAGVYRAASNRAVDALFQNMRKRAVGCDVPMFPKGARGAKDALAYLRGGGYLAMLIDQKMNDGVEARLFGLPAMTAPAGAALALRFGCPVIPAHVERVGPAKYRVIVDPPLELPDSGNRQDDVLRLTQMMNDHLEGWIREKPESWLWLHRRFPKDVVRTSF